MSLRIAICCYPTFGGSGIIASEIAESLAARGHQVHVVASSLPQRLDPTRSGVRFHAVEVKDYPLFDQSPYALALASRLVDLSRSAHLELLHVHYAVPHATSAHLAREVLGAEAPRLVTTLHGTDITLVGNDPSFFPITRFSMLRSDLLTVPSRFLAAATRDNFALPAETEIEVIPNFVDLDRHRPDPAAPRGPVPLVCHSSNFRAVKRVDDVVRVFARVRAARPAHLALIGDGPERPAIERLVAHLGLGDDVRFLGARRDFVEILQRADLFLMPSGSESFGLAALEAQACGLPVIASRVGGVPEVIEDGVTGLLAPVGAVDEMAAAALALLDDRARWQAMSAAARRRAETLFPREAIVDRYLAAYARVLGRGI